MFFKESEGRKVQVSLEEAIFLLYPQFKGLAAKKAEEMLFKRDIAVKIEEGVVLRHQLK